MRCADPVMATVRVRHRIARFSGKNKPCSLSRFGQRGPGGCGGLLTASRLRRPSGGASECRVATGHSACAVGDRSRW
jgi:hypothetical protein